MTVGELGGMINLTQPELIIILLHLGVEFGFNLIIYLKFLKLSLLISVYPINTLTILYPVSDTYYSQEHNILYYKHGRYYVSSLAQFCHRSLRIKFIMNNVHLKEGRQELGDLLGCESKEENIG